MSRLEGPEFCVLSLKPAVHRWREFVPGMNEMHRGALGWALRASNAATVLTGGIALGAASLLLLLMWSRATFEPAGIAERHFGWDPLTLQTLSKHLVWFAVIGIPLGFIAMSLIEMYFLATPAKRYLTPFSQATLL